MSPDSVRTILRDHREDQRRQGVQQQGQVPPQGRRRPQEEQLEAQEGRSWTQDHRSGTIRMLFSTALLGMLTLARILVVLNYFFEI